MFFFGFVFNSYLKVRLSAKNISRTLVLSWVLGKV